MFWPWLPDKTFQDVSPWLTSGRTPALMQMLEEERKEWGGGDGGGAGVVERGQTE